MYTFGHPHVQSERGRDKCTYRSVSPMYSFSATLGSAQKIQPPSAPDILSFCLQCASFTNKTWLEVHYCALNSAVSQTDNIYLYHLGVLKVRT